MTRIAIRSHSAEAASTLAGHGIHPVLARILAARGVARPDELTTELTDLLPPAQRKGIEDAARYLADAIAANKRLLIIADYDCDGATACAVGVRGLRMLGAQVSYIVPNRFEFGYGLSPEIVALAAREKPDVLVTVDNGIADVAGVAAANALGIDVVVTDHHMPGAQLPEARVIVNPNQPGCGFPSKNLAGVGVMFYVLLALRAELRARGVFTPQDQPRLDALLDLVALGTVADVVPLDRINRTLVEQGLRRLRSGRASPGVAALTEVSGRAIETLVASDFGFGLGPRLNAAGRLENMRIGIECLLADTPDEARDLAGQLHAINENRKERETQMRAEAEQMVEQIDLSGSPMTGALCLHSPTWHEGVVGLIASRIKDRIHRPVVACAGAKGVIKGSARSIPGVHIRDVLARVDTLYPGMIERFGGHAMAAGLTLQADRLDAFRDAMSQAVEDLAAPGAFEPVQITDGDLAPEEITLDQARRIRYAGPWGQGFPEPVFDGVFEIFECRPLSDGRHLRLRVSPQGAGLKLDAIAFNAPTMTLVPALGLRRMIYTLDVNRYRGVDKLQLRVVESLDPRIRPQSDPAENGAPTPERRALA